MLLAGDLRRARRLFRRRYTPIGGRVVVLLRINILGLMRASECGNFYNFSAKANMHKLESATFGKSVQR